MASLRASDRWIGLGLIAFIYIGAHVINWQVKEDERLRNEAQQKVRQKAEVVRARRPKEKTEDDITLEDLGILAQLPDYNIRQAALEILLQRFANNPICRKEMNRRLGDPSTDPEDRALALHLVHWALFTFNINLIEEDPDAAAHEPGVVQPSGPLEPEADWEDTEPLFQPGFSMETGTFERSLSPSPTVERVLYDSTRRDSQPEDNRTLFSELPMDFGQDELGSESETDRRSRRREAMVLGTDSDGLELFQNGELQRSIEGVSPMTIEPMEQDITPAGLMARVRGLDHRVQGLLDTLRQMDDDEE